MLGTLSRVGRCSATGNIRGCRHSDGMLNGTSQSQSPQSVSAMVVFVECECTSVQYCIESEPMKLVFLFVLPVFVAGIWWSLRVDARSCIQNDELVSLFGGIRLFSPFRDGFAFNLTWHIFKC